MNRRTIVAVLTLLVLALSTCAVFAQRAAAPAAKPAAVPPAASAPVATVGGRPVPRAELDQRAQQVLAEYSQRKGGALSADMHDLVRRQVLEGLIRAQLMTLEAKRKGMSATEAEGEEALKQLPVFNTGGKFDAARYQGIKATHPEQFTAALAAVREQLGARKLAAATEQRLSPPASEMRASALHTMSRVTLDMLPLRSADFSGQGEEPREAQIESWYRSHTSDYQREARATLTVVFVNAPPLADSLKHTPSAVAEWNQNMRDEAERIIGRVQTGESLDSVAMQLGPRSNIVVARDNFPGYWRGTPEQSERVFEARSKGRVLPEPVLGNDGWLVVRVDDTTPAHLAPLREVAREIRSLLRRENRLHRDDNDCRALYAQVRDSLAAPGWPIRYAVVDTGRLVIPEPGAQDLDTYFRAHQADYATFDPQTGAIVSRSFADVRDDVRARYLRDRRQLEARATADRLLHVWTSGGRDAALESRLGARVTPAVVSGSLIDTGFVAKVLSDTVWTFPNLQAGGILPYGHGFIVWQGLARVERVVPTLEQVRPQVTSRLEQRRAAADLAGGRALFDADAARFRRGNNIHFTRVTFVPRSPLSVTLTREEVEKWHHDHLDRYSAPEMVTARHILITPTDKSIAADQKALARAKEILRRLQAGEDFTTLARTYSEDPATRDIGGELGSFARGTLLEEFEKVAFSLPAGTLYDQPVKTEMGYHIIKVTEHLPPVVKPLPLIYSAVSGDAADDKANRLAREEADSLFRAVKDPRAFAEAGRRAGAMVFSYTIGADERMPNPQAQEFFTALRATPAGHIVPGSFPVQGQGTWLAVVDSIKPAGTPTWEEGRDDAIAEYRREAGTRALEAKRAELDSMLAGGMTLDSLAAYWGGMQRVSDLSAGRSLPFTGTSEEVDSLLFGGRKSEPGLPVGTDSGWVRSPGGITRLRIVSRTVPTPEQVAERAEQIRKATVEQKLVAYFEELKTRYPVVILDRRLRDLSLFATPQGPQAH